MPPSSVCRPQPDLGGLLVGLVPAAILKFVLGVILIVSAVRIFYR
jgi:hypothetical protein